MTTDKLYNPLDFEQQLNDLDAMFPFFQVMVKQAKS